MTHPVPAEVNELLRKAQEAVAAMDAASGKLLTTGQSNYLFEAAGNASIAAIRTLAQPAAAGEEMPEPRWIELKTPGADFDITFVSDEAEASDYEDGEPVPRIYLYTADQLRAFGHACRVVDEDAVAEVLNRLEGWAKAYPVDMFHEPTKEERDWLHATKPGLMDCIAASMGRHIASCIASDLAKLRAALEPTP